MQALFVFPGSISCALNETEAMTRKIERDVWQLNSKHSATTKCAVVTDISSANVGSDHAPEFCRPLAADPYPLCMRSAVDPVHYRVVAKFAVAAVRGRRCKNQAARLPVPQDFIKVNAACRPRRGRRSLATGETRGMLGGGMFDPCGVEYLAAPCP